MNHYMMLCPSEPDVVAASAQFGAVAAPSRLTRLQGSFSTSDTALQHSRHFDTGCIWLVGNGDIDLRWRRPFFRNPFGSPADTECALSRREGRTYETRTSFKARFLWDRSVFESLATGNHWQPRRGEGSRQQKPGVPPMGRGISGYRPNGPFCALRAQNSRRNRRSRMS
jgi:hypothetical protein